MKCDSYGDLSNATFESEEGLVNFLQSSFEADLYCSGATFRGPASFNTLNCGGSGFFRGAEFESEEEVDFGYASFGIDLYCEELAFPDGTTLKGTVFKGPVNFESLNCGGSGLFSNATFENEEGLLNFFQASFGASLDCSGATFRGPASFNTLKCGGSGSFSNAAFENEEVSVSFFRASFDADLDCNGATFRGPASFNTRT